ncbi:MAG: VWA domain-containing protein [Planctomycetes bacterium]|nr:VWA domain-containing protein [Planctomycetota bacterium]
MTHWNPVVPGGLIAFAVAALAAVALLAAWRTRLTIPIWANLSALGMRLVALGCAAVLILRPETVRVETMERHPPLLVLVDDSQSLRLRDTDAGPSRAVQAKPFLAGLLAAANDRNWEVLSFDAGVNLQPRHPKDDALRASAPESPLGEMLAEATSRALAAPNAPPPGAAILMSDGVVNRGRPLAEAAAELGRRNIPLFTVILGEAAPLPPDAALEELTVRRDEGRGETDPPRAGERVLVEARAFLQPNGPELTGPLADTAARLQVSGPPGGLDSADVPAAVHAAEGAFVEVDSLRHRLRTAPGWTPVRLRFQAKAPGFYRIRLSLDPLKGERVRANNAAYGSIEVLPPKRRVLFIASRLGHDYRRMKELFANWDGPEVDIFADFLRPVGSKDEPPPDWPVETALRKRMDEGSSGPGRAATIVWDNPDPAHLSVPTLARLRAGLETGEFGIVWVLNETPAELGRRLRGTPLEDAFLFKDFSEPAAGAEPAGDPLPVSARPEARVHPITQFASGTSGPEPWQALGPTLPAGPLKQPRANTQVLLAAGTYPVLSAGQVGQGRVVLVSTSETWRWLTPSKNAYERREQLASELWRRMLDWVSGSASRNDSPVRIFMAKDRWDLGEALSARVSVKAPAVGEPVKVEYALTQVPDDGSAPLPPEWKAFAGDTGVSKGGDDASASDPGMRVLSGVAGTPPAAGEWLVRVRALRPNRDEIGTDRAQVVTLGSGLEERSVRPDFAGMNAASQAAGAGGRALRPDKKDLAALLNDLEPLLKGETITREERLPAVSVGAMLILLACALIVDTWLRRG